MFNVIKPGTRFNFLSTFGLFTKLSVAAFVASLLVIAVKGVNLGLDFDGGHEILLGFDPTKSVESGQVRTRLNALFPDVDTTVQSFEVPTSSSTFYLTRIERSETFGAAEVAELEQAFRAKYAEHFARLRYSPEAGDVVEVEFVENATVAMGRAIDTTDLEAIVAGTDHEVRLVRPIGRGDRPRYAIVLKGVDVSVVNAMKDLDASVFAAKVEFVGPAVGQQLRDDGLLAVLYALIWIMIYIALRFDFFYAPPSIMSLIHDAIITVALLSIVGEEFSLATIAGLLTLVGYSINDKIVVFDRVRETIGKAQGAPLRELVNRAINETLGRTLMTGVSVLLACLCLLAFGRGTVLFSFGLIMFVGTIVGTYSSFYVAAPLFLFLRERFGPKHLTQASSQKGARAEV